MQKLIYVHVGLSSFVKKDIAILEESYELSCFHFDLSSKKRLPLVFLKAFFFQITRIASHKGTVVQFGGYQSFVPVLLKRLFKSKVVLILGGTDTVSFPSIQYGCFYNKTLAKFTRFSIKHASLLLPVAESLIEVDYFYQDEDFPKQGYKFHVPDVITPVKTIYNGYDAKKWQANPKEAKSFVTVAADLGTRFGARLKGIDLIVEVAPYFPDCKFYVVGGSKLKQQLPENVIPLGNYSHEDLADLVSRKQFYLQLSMSEGFPNALCEAMLCECIPIVSSVGAMKMIVDNEDLVLTRKNIDLLKTLISNVLISDLNALGKKARKRVQENYPLVARATKLLSALKSEFN